MVGWLAGWLMFWVLFFCFALFFGWLVRVFLFILSSEIVLYIFFLQQSVHISFSEKITYYIQIPQQLQLPLEAVKMKAQSFPE